MADQPDLYAWEPLLDDLRGRKERAAGMGGPDLVARQRSLGKLPVRERLRKPHVLEGLLIRRKPADPDERLRLLLG